MKPRGPIKTLDTQRFIDALRACIGKPPIYDHRRRTELERFYVLPPDGNRRVPRARIPT